MVSKALGKLSWTMTPKEKAARAQSLGVSMAEYDRMTPAEKISRASQIGTRLYRTTTSEVPDWYEEDLGGGGGGGISYRPQTAEEAANLLAQAELYRAQAAGIPAQTALYGAQTADIPLARELERRRLLAEVGVQQAERAANPRRIFEALYAQARLQPTEMAKGLQERMNIPGFKHGGKVKGAATGKTVEGPVIVRVGKNDDEYALLMPGSVVAPKPAGEEPTPENASRHIVEQMRKGGIVSKAKAKKILRHGSVRGRGLTEKQKGLFGLIAGGGTPTRLPKAQEGMEVYGLTPDMQEILNRIREEATGAIMGAVRPGVAGTAMYDPLGGSTFTGEQASFLRGLNLKKLRKLSPTSENALYSMLSAHGVEPEDYVTSVQRQLEGLSPVTSGAKARFSGMLGRR